MSAVSNTSTDANMPDGKSVDVTAKIQECRDAIEASKIAAGFVDDLQEFLGTDDAFVRALVERVAGPLPASVKSIELYNNSKECRMSLIFNEDKYFSWSTSRNVEAENRHETPAEYIEYGRRFMQECAKHPDFVAWKEVTSF